jgi:hypothetical protein
MIDATELMFDTYRRSNPDQPGSAQMTARSITGRLPRLYPYRGQAKRLPPLVHPTD